MERKMRRMDDRGEAKYMHGWVENKEKKKGGEDKM